MGVDAAHPMAALVAPEETRMLPPNGKPPYNFGRDPIDNALIRRKIDALALIV